MQLLSPSTKWVIALFSIFILSGCLGITQPTENDITELSKTHFDKQFKDLFTTHTVVKKNGYKDGDGRYIAEVAITAKAQRSLEEYANFLMNTQSISPLERIKRGMSVGLLKITLPNFEAGEQIEFARHYLFIKTDNGWLLKKEILEE